MAHWFAFFHCRSVPLFYYDEPGRAAAATDRANPRQTKFRDWSARLRLLNLPLVGVGRLFRQHSRIGSNQNQPSTFSVLGDGGWNLAVSGQDPNIVEFAYPRAISGGLSYITPQVVLELGTHAEFVPHDRFQIRSFVAEEFPAVIAQADIDVTALLAKRTFWEKVTILHAEYHRPAEKPLPPRYSRHYYDVAQLARGAIRDEALADRALLADVVRHKQTFYPSAWARYDLAHPGSLHLIPQSARVTTLQRDYRHMGQMIFGEPPDFGAIMQDLQQLEREIN